MLHRTGPIRAKSLMNSVNSIEEIFTLSIKELCKKTGLSYSQIEKLKRKENQVDTFDNMDKSFDELAQLLSFRDKESERKERFERKKEGKLSKVEVEMDDWDKEMKVCIIFVSMCVVGYV